MPKRSQITVNGRTYVLPKAEVEVEKLVRAAHAAKERLDVAKVEFDMLKDELIDIARGKQGKLNTVALGRIDLVAKVRFGQSISYDSAALTEALAILGERRFFEVFSLRTVYTAKKPLELFLKAAGDEKAKAAIQRATVVSDSAPKVTFEENEKV